jgi:hypothetical protein
MIQLTPHAHVAELTAVESPEDRSLISDTMAHDKRVANLNGLFVPLVRENAVPTEMIALDSETQESIDCDYGDTITVRFVSDELFGKMMSAPIADGF